jgi:type II secretion system protein G
MRIRHKVKRAFTLIEILIVVVILGILAAIVIPQFTDASDNAAQSSAKSQLQTVRSQIELFKFKESADPASFAAMVTAGYLQQDPSAQSFGDYSIVWNGGDPIVQNGAGADMGW